MNSASVSDIPSNLGVRSVPRKGISYGVVDMVECCAIVGAEAIGLVDVGGAYVKGRFERIFPPGIELGAWGVSNDSCLISGAFRSVGIVMRARSVGA